MALESQPLSIANVQNGQNGQNGVSIVGTETTYAQSTSGTITPTSEWSSTNPQPIPGRYIWTRIRNVLSNGTYTNYTYSATFNGRDAVVISETAPTNPVVGTLWQKPSDPTSTVLKWNGSAWVNWGISVDNLVADNIVAEDGTFKKITGLEVEGGIIRNPYVRTYNDSTARGEIVLNNNEYNNVGYLFYPNTGRYTNYSQTLGHQFFSMAMYDGREGTDLIAQAALSYDTLAMVDRTNGYSGILTARQLSSTLWQNLTYASGFRTSENNPCQYRITYDLQNNTLVQFRGQVERTSGTMSGTTYPFATLPQAIRTSRNYFATGVGDATAQETVRLGVISQNSGSIANSIQIKHIGNSQYIDISGLSYLAG